MVGSVVNGRSGDRKFKECLPVSFLYVNDPEAVDFLVPWFLLDQHVVDGLPSIQRDEVTNAEVEDVGY